MSSACKNLALALTRSGNLMEKAAHLLALTPPSSRDIRSMWNYLENDGGQVAFKERQYILEKEDLVTLRPGREHAWLDDSVEKMLLKWRCALLQVRYKAEF